MAMFEYIVEFLWHSEPNKQNSKSRKSLVGSKVYWKRTEILYTSFLESLTKFIKFEIQHWNIWNWNKNNDDNLPIILVHVFGPEMYGASFLLVPKAPVFM